jgi:uncharacterized RDD family membrane protein YckC
VPPAAEPARPAAPAATAVLAPREGQRFGRFELVAMIGQGGMGTVYRARDGAREVALKLLHPGLQSRPDFLSRFQREAKAVSSLQHENIVRVLDSGVERGTPWLAMELVEGEDLLAVAQRGGLAAASALPLMIQAARGLDAAARVGITHRDVKPGNLLVRADGLLKVADFGLAKAVDSSTQLTMTGEILGTPHYMAPEQGRGERVDHRADLYSLGATFYHVLGGAPPHEAETPVGVILKHLREEPLPLRARNPQVSVGLERVVHRLLQKAPDQRYASHAALLADLERVVAGREPANGADPPPRRVLERGTTYLLPHESPTELVLRPAGALRRLAAFVVDVAAIQVALWVLVVAGRALLGASGMPGRSPLSMGATLDCGATWKSVVLASACGLAAILYVILSDARGGRTLGKKWFSLRLCRKDGRDLGVVRASIRTALLLPGLALMVPTLSRAATVLLEALGHPPPAGFEQHAVGAGLAWLVVLELIGRMSALGRPLQDFAVGAFSWRAQRFTEPPRVTPSGVAVVSPRRALFLSIVPGLGVIYAGQFLIGIVFLFGTLFLLSSREDPRAGIALWIASALSARAIAQRRGRKESAAEPVAPAVDPSIVRRQES